MEISIYDAETNLTSLVQQLVEGKEDIIYISKNGKPIAKLTLVKNKSGKRLGVAKKEMKDFCLSLEDFNSIPGDGF